ncbi:MAG: peptidase T [Erysipelotrichaceae bacterium]|nr:peptidase T [Erysipelotrichaceae bacterium]
MKIESRFLKYISFDTQSDESSLTSPSTEKQLALADFLAEEMKILGVKNVYRDEFGTVYGVIPGNTGGIGDRIGFISHMDTSPDAPGANVNAQIIRDYDGGVITLNADSNIILSPEESPELMRLIHHDIITTDGTTLLGADDKAGIAIIMTMAEYLYRHPDFKHNDISIAFTTDEEIGRGTDHFDLERFDADYAYTIDGSDIEEMNFENFNAYSAEVEITGRSYHTGAAKGRMINALSIAREFDQMLGDFKRPETTQDREGFYHLYGLSGTVAQAKMSYLIRDHDADKMDLLLSHMSDTADYLNKKYPNKPVGIKFNMQYQNMRSIIAKSPQIVEQVDEAMRQIGLMPNPIPVRGGTDGAMLSYKGLPCPNLGTGGYNFHSVYEYVSLTSMKKGVQLLLRIIKNNIAHNLTI